MYQIDEDRTTSKRAEVLEISIAAAAQRYRELALELAPTPAVKQLLQRRLGPA